MKLFGKPKQPKYRVGWSKETPTMVRWECTCGAVGRWRSHLTGDNRLKSLWSLHVRKGHAT